mgnify:CR=1 FL=1
MINLSIGLQFVLAIMLSIAVLLQKSSSIGLGSYSGSNESLFGAKGPGNFLSKFTMIIGALFIANTLVLGYLYNQERLKSAVDNVSTQNIVPMVPKKDVNTSTPLAPAAPSVPTK